MFNRVILAGNLCRDPEQRFTPKGSAVCNFTVAANRAWRTETGERKDDCTFVDCAAWGRNAEVVTQYFRKGDPILVEGELRLNLWEVDGQKRSKLYIHVDRFVFMRPKQAGGEELPRAKASSDEHGNEIPF